MKKFQFQMIGWADDIANLEANDLQLHSTFGNFALQIKASLSKSVTDEHNCPDQILLNANDTDICVLLALSCYLERRLTLHQTAVRSEAEINFSRDTSNSTNNAYLCLYKHFLFMMTQPKMREIWCKTYQQQLIANKTGTEVACIVRRISKRQTISSDRTRHRNQLTKFTSLGWFFGRCCNGNFQ